jgi:glycosyltransferase involved in cell wall biosynthesis
MDTSHFVQAYKLPYASLPNTNYIGAVKRDELIRHQLEADLHLYAGVYDELFCISVAESQVAGAIPITSQTGALRTTNSFGVQIAGHPTESSFVDAFVDATVRHLQDPDLQEKQIDMHKRAVARFSLDRILEEWETRVFS